MKGKLTSGELSEDAQRQALKVSIEMMKHELDKPRRCIGGILRESQRVDDLRDKQSEEMLEVINYLNVQVEILVKALFQIIDDEEGEATVIALDALDNLSDGMEK